jgi:1,4-alpha-glucan branching enzyme
MERGSLALVLHAHLPYVRHPEHEYFLEENWLYEALSESYLPLVSLLRRLRDSREAEARLTISLSPTLVSMWCDELLRARYDRHLEQLLRLLSAESSRYEASDPRHDLARFYTNRLGQVRRTWQDLGGDLVSAFSRLQQNGTIEILTCAATHGYLPLMQVHPQAIRAQLAVAVAHHRKHFGDAPRGIWLPECGYYPGLDQLLVEQELRYFVADSHAIAFAVPRPHFGTYAPIYSAGVGVAVFPRDQQCSVQVWSRQHGYPGDVWYREYHRDLGHELGLPRVAPFAANDGAPGCNTGIKYYRITGPTDDKAFYQPARALERAKLHALDFLNKREQQMRSARAEIGRAPLVVAPYDAELFGHWWYEGPHFLEALLDQHRIAARSFDFVRLVDYLRSHPEQQLSQPAQSSWGRNGYHEVWLHSSNQWIYPPMHRAAEQMIELARGYPDATGLERRLLNQAARELLLLQSSDWAFMMHGGQTASYATLRTKLHLERFTALRQQLLDAQIDQAYLDDVERKDNLFSGIDYRVYA